MRTGPPPAGRSIDGGGAPSAAGSASRSTGTIVGIATATPVRGGVGGGWTGSGITTPCRSKTTGIVKETTVDSSFRPSVNAKPR